MFLSSTMSIRPSTLMNGWVLDHLNFKLNFYRGQNSSKNTLTAMEIGFTHLKPKTRKAKWSWNSTKTTLLVLFNDIRWSTGGPVYFTGMGFETVKLCGAYPDLKLGPHWTEAGPLPNKYSETGHEWCDCIAFNMLLLASNLILWLIHAHGKSNFDIHLMSALKHRLWF